MAYAPVLARLELTQLHLDEGRRPEARVDFARAVGLVESEFAGPGGRDWLARVGTLVALADGDSMRPAMVGEIVDPSGGRSAGPASLARSVEAGAREA